MTAALATRAHPEKSVQQQHPEWLTIQQRLDVFVAWRLPHDEVVNAAIFAGLKLRDGALVDDSTAVNHGDAVTDGKSAFHVVGYHDGRHV